MAGDETAEEDDAEALIGAIRMLRGVLKVAPHVVEAGDWTAEERVRRELGEKLRAVLHPKVGV